METGNKKVGDSSKGLSDRVSREEEFRGSVMEAVLDAVPGTPARWDKTETAGHRALSAVKDGIKSACEISVALAPRKEDAIAHVSRASQMVLSVDPVRLGSHLAETLEAIDKTVAKAESDQWKGYSPDQVKFVKGNFRKLCSMLDAASLDPELIDGGSAIRAQLFPGLESAEYQRRGARHVKLVYTGPKGVASLMKSETGRGVDRPAHPDRKSAATNEKQDGVGVIGQMLRAGGELVGALRRGGTTAQKSGSPAKQM